MNHIPTIALSLALLTSTTHAVYAPFALGRSQVAESFQNQTWLTTQEANTAQTYLKNHLSLQYPNHSFRYDHVQFHNPVLSQVGDNLWQYQVDVTLHTTVTLQTTTQNHPILIGMQRGMEFLPQEDIDLLLPSVRDYESNLAQAYGKSQDMVACYRLLYTCDFNPSQSSQSLPAPAYYYGHRYTNEDSQLPTSYLQSTEKYSSQVQQGEQAVLSLLAQLKESPNPTEAVFYDRQKAVAYAQSQATAYPEYNAENRMGNDCANFVSFALATGGIPTDPEGDWYPSPTVGTYGGLNWIRTGFVEGAGGVVPYLTDANLFLPLSHKHFLTQGGILFYKEDSHVSLVTYHDGEIMLHAYHSNETVEFSNYLHEGNYALYYNPHPNIIGGNT